MQLLFGYTPGARPPSGIPLLDADPFDMLVLTACGIAGFVAARLARLPAAAIPGPMLFSAGLPMTGVTAAKPPPDLVNPAPVVVGPPIGFPFAAVTPRPVPRPP